MIRRFALSFAVVPLVGGSEAAEARACQFIEWGLGYTKVEDGGKDWTYSVSVSGPDWKHEPVGHHGPGLLVCQSCASHGQYFLPAASVAMSPTTAAERAQRRVEWFGDGSFRPFGPEQLEHQSSRERVVVGPLAGYAVRYHATLKASKAHDELRADCWSCR